MSGPGPRNDLGRVGRPGTAGVGGAHARCATPPRRRARSDSGAVTAEASVVIVALLGVALGLVWLLGVVIAQVRMVDAGREVARLAGRGESTAVAVAGGTRIAPDGTRFTVVRRGDRVTVTARAVLHGPGGLLKALPGVTLHTTAVSVREPR